MAVPKPYSYTPNPLVPAPKNQNGSPQTPPQNPVPAPKNLNDSPSYQSPPESSVVAGSFFDGP